MRMICLSNLLLGRYNDAVRACERTAARGNWWADHVLLVAVYSQLGDSTKAAVAKTELLKRQPGFTLDKHKAADPAWKNPGYGLRAEAHLYAGLRKAGLADR